MKVKKVLANGLIYFVIASVSFLAGKSFRPPASTENNGQVLNNSKQPTEAPKKTGVYLTYYFYGKKRCVSCMKVEELTKAVASEYADAVIYEFVDCDRPENYHYMQELELSMKTVVVSRYEDGKRMDYSAVDMGKAFGYAVADEAGFRLLLQGYISPYLETVEKK